MIGRTISHYRMDQMIGQGGMGVVYRAQDLRLDREVAIKILAPYALGDPEARRRFEGEARAISRLNHPNIAVIHEFDSADGVDFIVMELLQGETLDQKLESGALSEAEVLAIGRQLASALAAAHARRIIHRDVKTANVMIDPEGHLKVLDFGLAKLHRLDPQTSVALTASMPGTVSGTLSYMAPEQLRGDEVDNRTDLYALGVVLFECLCGRRPFDAKNALALAGDVLNATPPKVASLRGDVSPALAAVVDRCLEKDRSRRPASAAEVLDTLHGIVIGRESVTTPEPAAPRTLPRRTLILTILLVVSLALTALFGLREWGAGDGMTSLAVLPLTNLTRDPAQEYFADGMTEELSTRISQLGALHVISTASAMRFKGSSRSPREIGRDLGVEALVTGSVLRVGSRTRISAQLLRASTGENLWAESFEGDLSDVLALQARVAGAVAERIRARLTRQERAALTTAPAVNAIAHDEYLRGRYYWHQYSEEGFRRALDHFQRALDADPRYAPAYAGLAETYTGMSSLYSPPREAMPRARVAAERALAIDSTLADARMSLAYVQAFHDWNFSAAETSLRRALELSPNSSSGHLIYGYLLIVDRRFHEAERELDRAIELDPLSPALATFRAMLEQHRRRYDIAVTRLREVIRVHGDTPLAHALLGQTLMVRGEYDSARVSMERAIASDPSNAVMLGWLGYLHAIQGREDRARQLLARLDSLARDHFAQPYAFAVVHTGLREWDRAFMWLERGVVDRSEQMLFLRNDPGMDPLRADPRYPALVGKLGLRKEPVP